MKKTTLAHLMIDRMATDASQFDWPIEYKGDLLKEHGWAMDTSGGNFMERWPDLFEQICYEIDEWIAGGIVVFHDTGLIEWIQ